MSVYQSNNDINFLNVRVVIFYGRVFVTHNHKSRIFSPMPDFSYLTFIGMVSSTSPDRHHFRNPCGIYRITSLYYSKLCFTIANLCPVVIPYLV